MNVLLINGSPNKQGSTYTALRVLADTLEKDGIETNILQVGHLDIRGCIGCGKCKETGACAFADVVNEIAAKFAASDGLVLGSPVYYGCPNGTLISLLDRLFFSSSFDKTMKVGAAVVVARRGGCSTTFDILNKYFTISGMPVAPSQYWNSVHGHNAQEVKRDLEGMQTMRHLGANMGFLIKSIALGKQSFGLPQREPWTPTNFITD